MNIYSSREQKMEKAFLILATGETIEGNHIGASGCSIGELVFTTGMEGYTETLTDPSYAGQTVIQTFPLIGNYGVNAEDCEGKMAGNNIRCVAKYLYDNGLVRSEFMKIETAGGITSLRVFTRDGKVSSVTAEMGKADFSPESVGAAATLS